MVVQSGKIPVAVYPEFFDSAQDRLRRRVRDNGDASLSFRAEREIFPVPCT